MDFFKAISGRWSLIPFFFAMLLTITGCPPPDDKCAECTDRAQCPECGECPKCEPEVTLNGSILLISDVHLNIAWDKVSYAPEGGQCYFHSHDEPNTFGDAGTDLWKKAVKEIDTLLSSPTERPDFMVFLGDLPAHNLCGDELKNNIGRVLRDMRTLAQKHCVPLVYSPGNNDGLDGDYSPFTSHDGKTPFDADEKPNAWPLIVPTVDCQNGPKAQLANTEHLDLGYYSAYPLGKSKKLRTITLNSVIFDKQYPKASFNSCRGSGQITADQRKQGFAQLDWLENQLKEAQKDTETVILTMHIPPGESYFGSKSHNWTTYVKNRSNQSFDDRFGEIVSQYDNIAALLYGHTHLDELKILEGDQANIPAVSCPGITPQHCNNPAFKIVNYDPGKDFALTGFKTYYSAFDTGSKTFGKFKGTYSFKNEYGIQSSGTMIEVLSQLNGSSSGQQQIGNGLCQTRYAADPMKQAGSCAELYEVAVLDYANDDQ